MKLKIETKTLLNALNAVGKAVMLPAVAPAMEGVKIVAENGKVSITGTGADMSVRTVIDAVSVKEEGTALLNHKFIMAMVQKMDSDEVSITSRDDTLYEVKGTRAKFRINGMNPDNFPDVDLIPQGDALTVKTDDLKRCISQVVFAASNKEIRPVLTGVNFQTVAGKLVATATDSYRLARTVLCGTDIAMNTTIPAKSLKTVAGMLDADKDVSFYPMNGRSVFFIQDNLVIRVRALDGVFPDVNRLVPDRSSYSTILRIDRADLLKAVDRTLLFTEERVTIDTLTISQQETRLTSKSQEIGDFNEELAPEAVDGEDLRVSFSATYMLDALKTIPSDKVAIRFVGKMKPFTIADEANEDLVQLMLPVRTYED